MTKIFLIFAILVVFGSVLYASRVNVAAGLESYDLRVRRDNRPPRGSELNILSETVNGERVRFKADEIVVKFQGDENYSKIALTGNETVAKALSRFRQRGDVISAERNYLADAYFIPNDTYYNYQWSFDNSLNGGIHMEDAWEISSGTNVIVAVIDTGVAFEDYNDAFDSYSRAPDLAAINFVPGYDFVNNDTHPNDDEGHGTHVAGTIAQRTNNNSGTAGIAYNAKIMPIKVLDSGGSGSYSDIADGIIWAADNGAKVINLSLGGSASTNYLRDAVAYAYSQGVTIVAAAGNDSSSSISYPAAYDDYVIAVGATRFDKNKASYSNYGASLDITAPGGEINLDQNGDGYGDGILQQTFGDQFDQWSYYFYQGTSMATPHVAAVAALLISQGSAISPGEVRSALQSTAEDLGTAGRDDTFGWGLLNAAAALGLNVQPTDSPPQVDIVSPSDGAVVQEAVIIQATATDDFGVIKVEFFVDDALIDSVTGNPYQVSWNSVSVPDGQYLLIARAYDTVNQIDEHSAVIEVDNINQPPIANAGPDQSAITGEIISFNGAASSDPDGLIASYDWDFGDLTSDSGQSPDHAYNEAGNYTVVLTVSDNKGSTDEDTLVVSVTDAPAEAAEAEVFFDSFENRRWNGFWAEDDQRDWYRSRERAFDGSRAAQVDGSANDATLTSIAIDLLGKNNATINFWWYMEHYLDSGEYVAFDVSTDGGSSWSEKAIVRGQIDPADTWLEESIDVEGINQLKIRFRGKMSRGNEEVDVDLVKVTAW